MKKQALFLTRLLIGLPIVIFILLSNGGTIYGQSLVSSGTDLEYKTANHNASEASNYAEKALHTENLAEAKSYMQHVLLASREAKNATLNAEKLLIEQEKQISNSTNTTLIENVKDQREEITKAIEEATIASDLSEKASQATDLETLHDYAWEISKASKKVKRQIDATLHYFSLLNDAKTN